MTAFDQLVREIADLRPEELEAWIECGWVRPLRSDDHYEFSDIDVARCRLICEMRQEFEIDDETMPLVLSLMDQIYGLRHRMRLLLGAIQNQPAETRDALARSVEELLESRRT
jgi:chaperone modulatory protein CbpM